MVTSKSSVGILDDLIHCGELLTTMDLHRTEAVPNKRLDGSRGFLYEVESLSYASKVNTNL